MNLPISNDELLRCVFVHSVPGIAVTDSQGLFLRVNPALCRLLGYAESELQGAPMERVFQEDDHAALQTFRERVLAEGAVAPSPEWQCQRRDGTTGWVATTLSAVPTDDGPHPLLVWQFVDVNDCRRTEQELRDANRRLTEAQQIARIGHWSHDPQSGRTEWSDEMYRILGMTGMRGAPPTWEQFLDCVHPEDRERVRRRAADLETTGTSSQDYRIVRPDGTERVVRGHRNAERGPDGRVRRVLGTLQDITEQVATEQALQERIQRDTLFLNTMQEGYWVAEMNGRITEVNDAYCRMVGYTADELLALTIADIEAAEDPTAVDRHMAVIVDTGFDRFETRHRCKDGEVIDVEVAATFGEFGGRQQFLVFARDISERKRTEREQKALLAELQAAQQQLVQSEKMAALGQLAAGVAHEINNPVGYISSNLTSLDEYLNDLAQVLGLYRKAEAELDDRPDLQARLRAAREESELDFILQDVSDLVAESREGVQRVNRIVQDLKSFSHSAESEEWEWADLREGIKTTLNIVHNELKYKAEVIQALEEIPPVECIPSQLNQVFMNLLVNAAHAIERHGRITIRTTQGPDGVVVEVTDTGEGIPEAIRNRVFDPFFTTKDVGQGTGLGLSISHKIVEKHGGRIDVESEPGVGTTFRVVLPVRREAANAPAQGEVQEGP